MTLSPCACLLGHPIQMETQEVIRLQALHCVAGLDLPPYTNNCGDLFLIRAVANFGVDWKTDVFREGVCAEEK